VLGGASASTVSGNLLVTASGAITDGGNVTIVGTTSLTAGSGNNITLDGDHDFGGAVTIVSGNTVTLNDTGAIALGTSTVSGNLIVTASGAITQTGAVAITGTTSLTAGSGNNITLSSGNNFVGTVSVVSGNDVTLSDINGYSIGASTISGVLDATTTAGAITVVGMLTMGSGNVNLHPAGNLRISERISATSGTVTLNPGGTIYLNYATNPIITSTGAAATLEFQKVVVLEAAATVTASGGATIQFDVTVNGSFALVVNTAGTTTFTGAVGDTTPLVSLTTNSGGTTSLGGDVATSTGGQDFGDAVTVSADRTFESNAATLVRFRSTLGGGATARSITISLANARFDGNVGEAGDLVSSLLVDGTTALYANVTTSGSQTYTGAVTIGADVSTITGTGALSFDAAVNQSGTCSLTIQDASSTGAVTFAGAVTLQGLAPAAGAYSITMNGGCTIATLVSFANTGGVTLGDASADLLTFALGMESISAGTNTFQGTVTTDLAAGSDITLSNLTVGAGGLTFNASGALGNVILSGSATVAAGDLAVYAADFNTAAQGSVTITPAAAANRTAAFYVTNLYLSSISTATGTTYYGIADLSSANFTVDTLSNLGLVRLTGEQATHSFTTYDSDSGTVEYYDGSADGTVFVTGMAASGYNYYNLRISGSARTFTLEGDLTARADVHIAGGYLDVSSSNYDITLGGDWENDLDTATWNTGTSAWDFGASPHFVARAGTVTFTKSTGTIYVYGNNRWYVFACIMPGVDILFENDHVQRILSGGIFLIYGSSGSRIELNRMTASGTPSSPPTTGEDSYFWFFDLIPGATLDMKYVDVYYSNARSNPVSVPSNVAATPYSTYYSYKWLNYLFAIYSYTEDSDYNGKIDRIRVTTEAAVGNDFTGFTAEVSGYTVTGYSRPVAGKTFYIFLEEKGYTDTGVIPDWRVSSNTTLMDAATGTKYVGTLSRSGTGDTDWMTPGDTAWPMVGYTLLRPGDTEAFVQFSEPVVTSAGNAPAATDFDSAGSGLTVVTGSGSGVTEGTWTTTARSVDVLAAGATNFSFTADLRDMGSAPYWDSAYSGQVVGAPYPTYPPETGYGTDPNSYSFATARDDSARLAANPFELQRGGSGSTIHRLSDVLVSTPPPDAIASYDPATYFVWPVWAKDEVKLSLTDAEITALTSTEASSLGVGLVRAFDGTQWLRDQDITLQVLRSGNLSSTPDNVTFDSNVASSYLSSYDLWLPTHDETEFTGIDGTPNGGTETVSSPASAGTNLYNFTIPSSSSKVFSVATVDFFLHLSASPSDLFVARLEPNPTATAWYRRLRPFTFVVHDVRLQRGGVSILNNVIDPTKGETTRLSYQLEDAGSVTITVFTLDGDVVKRLFVGKKSAGDYAVSWDGRNGAGKAVARGIYFVRVVAPGVDEIRKVLVVRK